MKLQQRCEDLIWVKVTLQWKFLHFKLQVTNYLRILLGWRHMPLRLWEWEFSNANDELTWWMNLCFKRRPWIVDWRSRLRIRFAACTIHPIRMGLLGLERGKCFWLFDCVADSGSGREVGELRTETHALLVFTVCCAGWGATLSIKRETHCV